MRVISGKYKGRKLDGFNIIGTRPTMDRIKESLFATIQNYVPNSRVLDLFAGSGSLGIEALSNGASTCTFVDNNHEMINILKRNTKNITGVVLYNGDYRKALLSFSEKKEQFDLIFLDPPYKFNLINDCLEKIYDLHLLSKDGIIICEFEHEQLSTDKFIELKRKRYADKNIVIYKI